MRTTIRLPDDLLKRAKKRAAEDGRTLASLVPEGVAFVLSGSVKKRRAARIEVPVSRASGGVLPGVDLDRYSDLEESMEDA